jgi:hypothetical protein
MNSLRSILFKNNVLVLYCDIDIIDDAVRLYLMGDVSFGSSRILKEMLNQTMIKLINL